MEDKNSKINQQKTEFQEQQKKNILKNELTIP